MSAILERKSLTDEKQTHGPRGLKQKLRSKIETHNLVVYKAVIEGLQSKIVQSVIFYFLGSNIVQKVNFIFQVNFFQIAIPPLTFVRSGSWY